jgi:hypothetical protein
MDADAAGLAYPSVRADKSETRAVLADRRHLPLDQARRRPHLRDRAELVLGQAEVFQAEHARAVTSAGDATAPRWKTSAGDVDHERMRGLPMIAPGVQGAQRGTDPLSRRSDAASSAAVVASNGRACKARAACRA